MPILEAENHFRKGLVALVDHKPQDAAGHFHAAIQIEKQRSVRTPQMRYLSYYGLSLAMSHGATPEAIHACETAVRRDFYNPDLYLNLGRVYLLSGKTTRALATLERGLALAPRHRALHDEVAKVDRRAAPPLPMLDRKHVLNYWLGRVRAALRGGQGRRVPSGRSVGAS